jgi:beta-fructofuranosidase
MWECPNIVTLGGREFFFVCPQGVPSQLTKYQNNFNSGYFPVEGTVIDLLEGDKGLMDADAPYGCIDESTFVELDYGFDFYAPQIFTDEKGRQILEGWMGLPDIEMQYQVPTYEWLHTLTWLRELSLNDAGKICQWPLEEYNALRGAKVDFTAEGAKDSNGKLGTSNYDAYDICGAIGAKFANGTCDMRVKGIEGEGRILINGDLELVVINDMIELAFHGIAGGYRTVRRLPLSELSAGKLEDLRIVIDTSAIEIYVNGGEHTMSTRWFPQQIVNLNVTSTFKAAETYAYEMGRFTYKNVC